MFASTPVRGYRLWSVLMLLLPALIVIGRPASSTAAAAKPIELSMSLSIVEMNDRWLKVMKPWVETIQKESKGKVKINPFFVGTLTKEQQNYQGLVDGLIDLSYATFVSEWGRFPITEIMLVSPPGGKMYNRPPALCGIFIPSFPNSERNMPRSNSFPSMPCR